MSNLFIYQQIKAAVADWLARPGDTLITGRIDDMIVLFEAEAKRQLRTLQGEATGTLSVVAGDSTVQLPLDYLELRSARVSNTNPRQQLTFMTPDQFDAIAIADESGTPTTFTIENGAAGPRLRLGPVPDIAYTIVIRYFASFIPLTSAAQQNWLLASHPDAYLFGVLAEAEAFIGHDERIAMWIQRRDAALASINTSGQKALTAGGSWQESRRGTGFATYSQLQTALTVWLARPNEPLVTNWAADMIYLFEAEARRQLRTINGEATGTLATVAGDNTVLLPADYLELRSARISSTNPRQQLTYMTPDQFDTIAIADQSGEPTVFTIDTSALLAPRLRLGPTPDAIYTITISYYAAFIPLGTGLAQINWLLTSHPDAYLFGALAEAEAFIGHDERVAGWLQRRNAVLASINHSGQQGLWGGGALQIKTDTGNP